jgi:hypothetical protein
LRVTFDDDDGVVVVDDDLNVRAPLGVMSGAVVGVMRGYRSGDVMVVLALSIPKRSHPSGNSPAG